MARLVHGIRMPPLPDKANRGITPNRQKMKSKFRQGLPVMVPDLVHKFQMICWRELKLLSGNQMQDRQR